MSAPNMRTVIPAKRAIATSDPPGTNSLMLHGQRADGRTNHARNESGPAQGEMSPVPDRENARSKAVPQTIPTTR
jgi:hypothetical protein